MAAIFLFALVDTNFVIIHQISTNFFICITICLDRNKIFERRIINIFLPVSLNICFGCSKEPSHCQSIQTHVLGDQKNRLSEMILLSTHNICFG